MQAAPGEGDLGEVACGGQGHLKKPATCGAPTPSWMVCPFLKGDQIVRCLGLAQCHPVKTHLPHHLPGRNVGTLRVSRKGEVVAGWRGQLGCSDSVGIRISRLGIMRTRTD